MNALKKIDKGLVNISRVVLTVTVITEMVIVFSGVIARYVFNNSLAWVDELAGYLLLVITCFGCHIAYYEKSLAAVTVFVDRLPFALRKLFRTVANVSIVILMVLLAKFAAQLCLQPAILKTVTPALQLPLVCFYVLLPIVAVFMCYHTILVLLEELFRKPEAEAQKTAEGEVNGEC